MSIAKKMKKRVKYDFKEVITLFLFLSFSVNFGVLFLAFLLNKVVYLNLNQLLLLNLAFLPLYIMILKGDITLDNCMQTVGRGSRKKGE
jgi:hypothetical protein